MQRMSVCLIGDSAGIHLQRIAAYLVEKGDKLLVLSTATRRVEVEGGRTFHLLSPARDRDKGHDERQTTWPLGNVKGLLPIALKASMKTLWRNLRLATTIPVCRREALLFKPDVVYCLRAFPEGFLASQCGVSPLVVRTAGTDIHKLPENRVYRRLVGRALASADLVLTETEWEKRLVRQLAGRDKRVETLLIGVDDRFFRPASDRVSLRRVFGLPEDAFVVVTNRYLTGSYNGWSVVRSVESISKQCPGLFLLYLSPVPADRRLCAAMTEVSERNPRIRFIQGPLPYNQVAQVVACGDIFVTVASYDGVPNSLLEAMACGLVPVVGHLEHLEEWIEEGRTGCFVPPGDVNALAARIRELYHKRWTLSVMGSRCSDLVQRRASYSSCMATNRRLMLDLAAKRCSDAACQLRGVAGS